MHYGTHAFSKNDNRTIETKDEKYQNLLGHRATLTKEDVNYINALYKNVLDDCVCQKLKISGLKNQKSKNGVYIKDGVYFNRYKYRQANGRNILYYWRDQNRWNIGSAPPSVGVWVNSTEICGEKIETSGWFEWYGNNSTWIQNQNSFLTCIDDCVCQRFTISGLTTDLNGEYVKDKYVNLRNCFRILSMSLEQTLSLITCHNFSKTY